MPDTPDVDALEIAAGAHTGGNAPGQAKRRAAVQTLADLARKATTPVKGYDWRFPLAVIHDHFTGENRAKVIDCPMCRQSCEDIAAYIEQTEAALIAANARADEAEAVCEWLAEEVAALNSGTVVIYSDGSVMRTAQQGLALNSGTVVIYSDGSVMRTAQQWLAAARNAVREAVKR